jgi:hypothetical protein
MNREDTIRELFTMIRELSEKMDGIEQKIEYITDAITMSQKRNMKDKDKDKNTATMPDFIPNKDFQQWISLFNVNKEDMDMLFGSTILDGFKHCLNRNIDAISEYPLWGASPAKTIQIFIYQNEAGWRIMTEEDIHILIDFVWRKMLEWYFILDEDEDYDKMTDKEQLQRDCNKKNLFGMKKTILTKYTKDIARCIIQRFYRNKKI